MGLAVPYMRSPVLLRAVPPGTMPVAVGLVVYGVTAYGFLVVAGRALGPERFGAVSVLWALTFVGAIGIFAPLEQEIARAVADRRARGAGASLVVRRSATMGGAVLALTLVMVAATAPVVGRRIFDDQPVLVVSLAVALAGYFVVHLVRGVLSGRQRMGSYGVLLAADGLLRLAACALLAAVEVQTAGAYGLALAFSPFVAVAFTVGLRPGDVAVGSGGDARWWDLWTAYGHLLLGALASQLLVNGPAVAVKALAAPEEKAVAGRFLAGLVITRVPLFLFAAVQAALVPALAMLAARGDVSGFRAALQRMVLLVLGLSALTVLVTFAVGPPVVRVLFGAEFSLERAVLTWLAIANTAFLLALLLAQALIALGRHAHVGLGWVAGFGAFLLALLLPPALAGRAALAFVIGSAAALTFMAVPLLRRRREIEPDEAEVVAPVYDIPG